MNFLQKKDGGSFNVVFFYQLSLVGDIKWLVKMGKSMGLVFTNRNGLQISVT